MASIYKKSSIRLSYIGLTILYFFYFYKADLTFLGLPAVLHSQRICAAILFLIALPNPKEIRKLGTFFSYHSFKIIVKMNVMILAYMFIIILFIGRGTGETIIEPIINQILFGFLLLWSSLKLFKEIDYFMSIILGVHIIQTVIIWGCALSPDFMYFIDMTFNRSDWYSLVRVGYAGGIGCITSSGAVKFGFGLVACLYKYCKTRSMKYLLLYIVLLVTISMIARTGLFIALSGFLFILLYMKSFKLTTTYQLVILTIVIAVVSTFVNTNSSFFDARFGRFDQLQGEGIETWIDRGYLGNSEKSTTIIPPISWKTLLGTAIVSGKSGNGVEVNVDGGYIRQYVAFGLPLAVFFYFYIFSHFIRVSLKSKNRVSKYTLLYTTVVIAIGEFKEPYIYSIIPWSTFYIIAILSDITNTRNLKNKTLQPVIKV